MADPPLGGGMGVGWRPAIAGTVGELAGLRFCEVIAESLAVGGRAPAALPRGVVELRGRGVAVVPHGVRLSLGGAEPLDPVRVTHLAACAAALDAPLVSEHVAFVRAGGHEAGHLLPLPRSRGALDVLTAHVRQVQAELDVPLALEPVASLFDWPDDEYTEGEFLTALLERTGAMLLLDVANVYANARNRGADPEALLDAIPLDRVAYVHVAGGSEHDGDPGVYHDTHADPVPPPVLALLERLRERLDAAPAVMLERDGHYPPAAALHAELDAIAAAAALPPATLPCPATASPAPAHASPAPAHASPAFTPAGSTAAPRRRPPRTASPASEHTTSAFAPARHEQVADLTTRQAGLVATLVAGAPAPAGFDTDRLAVARRALLRKRAGEVAAAWPLLAASLGTDWPAAFTAFAATRTPAGALRDGWDLARELRRQGRLGDAAAVELAEHEVAWRYDGRSAPRRRCGPALRRVGRLVVLRLAGRTVHLGG